MISYVNFGTNDLEKAKKFYSELFSVIGVSKFYETERAVFFGKSPTEPLLAVCKPFNEKPATPGNGTMVAIAVDSKDLVDKVYTKALEIGGVCEGKPGDRIPNVLYAAYVRDLDGNKLAFVHRAAQ